MISRISRSATTWPSDPPLAGKRKEAVLRPPRAEGRTGSSSVSPSLTSRRSFWTYLSVLVRMVRLTFFSFLSFAAYDVFRWGGGEVLHIPPPPGTFPFLTLRSLSLSSLINPFPGTSLLPLHDLKP
jgi:hypothetical protein